VKGGGWSESWGSGAEGQLEELIQANNNKWDPRWRHWDWELRLYGVYFWGRTEERGAGHNNNAP